MTRQLSSKSSRIEGNFVDNSNPFLTVAELARLLHVNEKKIYKLAGEGDIPGTKITGKWIFPRQMVEDWIAENSHGGALSDRLIIAGSDDKLIKDICNEEAIKHQHSALISYSPYGTRHGLRMLDAKRADACFINWGATDASGRRHLGLLRGYRNHASWVMVTCFKREQGLVVSKSVFNDGDSAEKLLENRALRWAQRNTDSGSERLVQDLCTTRNVIYTDLNIASGINTERSAVAAVSTGSADITCASAATAHEFQLPFVPIGSVSIDLVMSRRTYFRTLTQALLNAFVERQANQTTTPLHGYTLASTLDVNTVT